MRVLRSLFFSISAVGATLFFSGFAISIIRPVAVETLLRDLIRRQVEQRVAETISSLDGATLSKLAARVTNRNAEQIDHFKRLLPGLPARVSAVVAEMQDPSCECRLFVATAANVFLTSEIVSRTAANALLVRFIRAKYNHVSQQLLREFRLVTVANALVFTLLGVVTFARKRAALQLLLPVVVLLLSAASVASFYLFAQDWLHTILFSDYVGLGYFAYLGVSLTFFADVIFNRARVSTEIVNTAFNLAGASIQAFPC